MTVSVPGPRGPGRPTTGIRIDFRLPHEDDREVRQLAEYWGVTDDEAYRLVVSKGLAAERRALRRLGERGRGGQE